MPSNARTNRGGWRRRIVIVVATLGISALLSGCIGSFAPESGTYRSTIPAALQEADIGVTRASAGSGIDGLTRYVSMHVQLDRDTLTGTQLGEILKITVPLIDQPGTDTVQLRFRGVSTSTPDSSIGDLLDITAARADLLISWGEPAPEYGDGKVGLFRESISMLRHHLAEDSRERRSLGREHA